MADQVTAAYSGQAKTFDPPANVRESAYVGSMKEYREMYSRSVEDPESFWSEQARRIEWIRSFKKVKDVSFASRDVHIRWFEGGKLNACYNCVDRHLDENADRTAFIFEPDDPESEVEHISYKQLHERVGSLANVLRKHGVKKGDRVTIYLPMIPQAVYSMLACARIGAIHSVVFGGFSPDSLADRIIDCDSTLLITADEGRRGGKAVPLKINADKALERCPDVSTVIVVKNTANKVDMLPGRDFWYHEETRQVDSDCEPEEMDAEDPLFILYTSGSTGKPKGVLHTTGGYLVFTAMTHQYVFDYHPEDVFWCTADVGWVTGHSYIVYGPLANGATQILF
ncbi:MAG: AMP-binding protein, partial [Rhodothermales bacterium]